MTAAAAAEVTSAHCKMTSDVSTTTHKSPENVRAMPDVSRSSFKQVFESSCGGASASCPQSIPSACGASAMCPQWKPAASCQLVLNSPSAHEQISLQITERLSRSLQSFSPELGLLSDMNLAGLASSPFTPQHDSPDDSPRYDTIALSLVFMVRECRRRHLVKRFQRPPFSFSHQVSLVSHSNYCVATQQFYEIHPELPLFAVNPIHVGKELIRFLILVDNISLMTDFYRTLLNLESESDKPNFSVFTLPSNSDEIPDVQIALKYSPQLRPKRQQKTYAIKIHLENLNVFTRFQPQWKLLPIITSSLKNHDISKFVTCNQPVTFATRDPEGNLLVIDTANHSAANQGALQNHSDYDSGLATSVDNGIFPGNFTSATEDSEAVLSPDSRSSRFKQSRSARSSSKSRKLCDKHIGSKNSLAILV